MDLHLILALIVCVIFNFILLKKLAKGAKKMGNKHDIQKDWRFKLGVFFICIGIASSILVLYFPPYELKDETTVEFNKKEGSGKLPVHQLPPLLSIAVGSGLFTWLFLARRQWKKIRELEVLKKS